MVLADLGRKLNAASHRSVERPSSTKRCAPSSVPARARCRSDNRAGARCHTKRNYIRTARVGRERQARLPAALQGQDESQGRARRRRGQVREGGQSQERRAEGALCSPPPSLPDVPNLPCLHAAQAVFDELVALVDPGVEPYKPKKGQSNVIMAVGLQACRSPARLADST